MQNAVLNEAGYVGRRMLPRDAALDRTLQMAHHSCGLLLMRQLMHTRRAFLTVLVLSGCGLASSAEGQSSASAVRVRIVEVASKRVLVVGQLVRVASDSALIVPDGANPARTESFGLGDQHRLERSGGTRHRTLRGAGIGFAAGAAGGALLAAATYRKADCDPESIICLQYSRSFSMLPGAVVGAVPGLVIGAIVGRSKSREVWRPLADRNVRMEIVPTARRGVKFAGRMSF